MQTLRSLHISAAQTMPQAVLAGSIPLVLSKANKPIRLIVTIGYNNKRLHSELFTGNANNKDESIVRTAYAPV